MRWFKRSTPAAAPAWSPSAVQPSAHAFQGQFQGAPPARHNAHPAAQAPHAPGHTGGYAAPPGQEAAWSLICEQFSQQVLLLAEQLRPAMDRLEGEEEDADRLRLLYQIDHSVTRIRRVARDLRVLGGVGSEELDGRTTELVDVIRVAESSIERYTQVAIGKVVQLAVVAYAADDVASLVVALLDNATRYSPTTVTVSAHLLDNGAVMLRVEDAGIGIDPERVRAINGLLAGPVPPVDADTGRHTGFPVVHRLARKHGIGVHLACRPTATGGNGGTIAMVVIPPALLCEIPADPAAASESGGHGGYGEVRPAGGGDRSLAHLTMAHRAEPPRQEPEPVPSTPISTGGELPRREIASLRRPEGDEPSASETVPASAPRDPAVAARSFAADLEAFTQGEREARQDDGGSRPDRAEPSDTDDGWPDAIGPRPEARKPWWGTATGTGQAAGTAEDIGAVEPAEDREGPEGRSES